MLPPADIEVPSTTKAIYITAISLSPLSSEASVNWSDSSATFGSEFPYFLQRSQVLDS